MKRIFSIMVVVLMIIAMAVPVFAADEYTISGIWVFNEVLDIQPVANQSFYPIAFSVNNVMYYGVKFGSQSFQCFTDSDYSHVFHLYNAGSGGWIESEYKILDFGTTEQTVSTEFYTWLTANATFQAPPPPLHQVVGELGATTMTDQWNNLVDGPIMTLVLCGVGCLALLVGLKLFGKRSLIYRI